MNFIVMAGMMNVVTAGKKYSCHQCRMYSNNFYGDKDRMPKRSGMVKELICNFRPEIQNLIYAIKYLGGRNLF